MSCQRRVGRVSPRPKDGGQEGSLPTHLVSRVPDSLGSEI